MDAAVTPEDAQAAVKTLTPKQRQVLVLTAQGFKRPEIATMLHRSQKTIDAHRQAFIKQMDVSNLYEACAVAGAAGIV